MKKLIATIGLMGIILMGNAAAKTGHLMSDFQNTDNPQPQTCSNKQTNSRMKINWGIFVTGFTGIFVTGFTGIIVIDGFTRTDSKADSKAGCRI